MPVTVADCVNCGNTLRVILFPRNGYTSRGCVRYRKICKKCYALLAKLRRSDPVKWKQEYTQKKATDKMRKNNV